MSQYTKTQFKFWDITAEGFDEYFTHLLDPFFTINFLFWLIRAQWGMRPADNKIALSDDDPRRFLFWLFNYLRDLTCSGDSNSSLSPGKMKLNWAELEMSWNIKSTYSATNSYLGRQNTTEYWVMKTLQKHEIMTKLSHSNLLFWRTLESL